MVSPGRRLFSVAAILLVVVAGLHTMGHFSPEPNDPARAAVGASMREHRLDLPLGMRPSLADVVNSLSLTMTITLLLIGALDVLVARSTVASLRPFALANVVGVGALAALYWHYRVSPPLVSFGLVWILFVLALVLPDRRHDRREVE